MGKANTAKAKRTRPAKPSRAAKLPQALESLHRVRVATPHSPLQDASATRGFTRAISTWFRANARGLPWRTFGLERLLALSLDDASHRLPGQGRRG